MISKGLCTALSTGLLAAACGGGSGGSGVAGLGDFELQSISVPEGAIWQVNRAIEFVFSDPVDFATVGPNTINIQTTAGVPANGVFSVKRIDMDGDGVRETLVPNTVIFQPTCPTRDDKSDSGLKIGSVDYVITVLGKTSNAADTVRSENDIRLETTQTRSFETPVSTDSTTAFLDPVPGPPQPVIRNKGESITEGVSYFEVGGDPNNRVFFEFDEATQTFDLSDASFVSPLNLYSDPAAQIAAMLIFNQPVSPESSNINPNFVRLEFLDGNGDWQEFETRVTLVANCTESGATVRLEPVGILPVASKIRAVINPGFRDLTGQEDNPLPLVDFAVADTETIQFASLTPADVEGDEIFEGFDFGDEVAGSREDIDAIFDTPPAEWGGGALTAGFTFAGTGGPNGTFDWIIPANTTAFLDTVSDQIIGGENGAPEAIQNIVGGFVDVRDMIIEEGATLRIQGSVPLCINASGDVIIRGTLDISGLNAKNVTSLNTGSQPEPGGGGIAGGGRGGQASGVTNNSTPKGGTGFGPSQEPNAGGKGGETSFNSATMGNNVNRRRPGGGGGGRFAPDLEDSVYGPGPDAIVLPSTNVDENFEVFGLKAQAGFDGEASGTGACTLTSPARGGEPGAGPFIDADEDNNFWGTRAVSDGMGGIEFIRGELLSLQAGYGGGGGGDASFSDTFPTPNWVPGADEKGGPGGGGGGGLHVKALGDIIFGQSGQILCNGGRGATGENTIFLDHVGGGGGGGSAGHVVLETASKIDFTDGQPNLDWGTNPFLMNEENGFMPFQGGRPRILARGGDGATIGDNQDGSGQTNPRALGYGGDGGPGIVQLHVPNPTLRPGTGIGPTDIIVPLQTAVLPDEDFQDMLRSIMAPGGIPMVPTFGARSRARSDWVTLGAAAQAEDGSLKDVLFYFGGTDPADGLVEVDSGSVAELDPLFGGILTGNNDVTVNAAGDTMTFGATSLADLIGDMSQLSNDIYLRTPALLQNCILRTSVEGSPGLMRSFDIVSASYDDAGQVLTAMVDVGNLGNDINRFITNNPGATIRYDVIPRFFRLLTDGVPDVVDENTTVRITFQATGSDAFGGPDEENILVDFTGDITEFNNQPTGAIQYVRFEVEFDLSNGTELTVDTDPVTVDFLRIPFRF